MDELIEELASNAADLEVARTAMNRPKHRQLRVWKRTYDSVYASLVAYQEIERARRIRANTLASEN